MTRFAKLFAVGIAFTCVMLTARADDAATPPKDEDRIATIEAKLEVALARIDALEKELAALKGGAPKRAEKPVKPAADALQRGSTWEGTLQIIGQQRIEKMSATVTKVDGDKFTVTTEAEDGGIFDWNCEVKNGRSFVTSVVRVRGGGPSGDRNAQNGDEVPMNSKSIAVKDGMIVIQFDRPLAGKPNLLGTIKLRQNQK